MPSPRKRSKPNPSKSTPLVEAIPEGRPTSIAADTSQNDAVQDAVTATSTPGPGGEHVAAGRDSEVPALLKKSEASTTKQLKSRSSWYGTWPHKSAPSTQIAKDTILADKPKNASPVDLSRFESKKSSISSLERPPSMTIGKSRETLEVNMDGTTPDTSSKRKDKNKDLTNKDTDTASIQKPESSKANIVSTTGNIASVKPPPIPEEVTREPTPVANLDSTQRPVTASGWLGLGGWLSRPYDQPQAPVESQPLGDTPSINPEEEVVQEPPTSATNGVLPNTAATTSSSWFGFWPTEVASQSSESEALMQAADKGEDTPMEDAPAPSPVAVTLPASGSWAFWSREPPKKSTSGKEETQEGELSVCGESSQESPQAAKITTTSQPSKGKVSKRNGPKSTAANEISRQTISPPSGISTPKGGSTKALPPNLLLPSVKQTYRLVENPTILQQLARLLSLTQEAPAKHLFLAKQPPKVKKALAIGVHGLFPAPLLRTIVGQPTGTSIKFANNAAAAIGRWAESNGSADCEIEKVALMGEGTIAQRVEKLWGTLLSHIDYIREADLIMVACHSQGVPVTIMLLAKLIEFGVVTDCKIAVCAMAGVSLGPFADYKSNFIPGLASELFEFGNPQTVISKGLEDSLRVVLRYGAKITYVGSIDDQLVSMESAIYAIASHPNIYRAVFVDGRIHAPDFLTHLVGFALKLRNLGVSDHGLIRELSSPLAGSLYTGEGHSRLYEDDKVYDLAISHALDTTPAPSDAKLKVMKYEIPNTSNPYVLPWIMRGLLEEEFVKTELSSETTELLKQFDEWKPTTKVLKDVKYRLEAVRSKL